MSKMKSFQVIALTLSMLMIISMVKGRRLDLETYSTSMTSVGVHNISNDNPPNQPLEISNSSTFYTEKRCKSLYGFFPCADTMLESVFLIFMYMYFMILGEELMSIGSTALFLWIGDKYLNESVFGVLKALPKIAVFVVPGVLSSASNAQNQVVFGVSMYAGSTVITLTLIWGIRVILSRDVLKKRSSRESDQQEDSSSRHNPTKGSSRESDQQQDSSSRHNLKKGSSRESDQQQDSSSRHNPTKGSSCESDHQQDSSMKCLSLLTDTGVNIDKDTGDMARNMLLSLIPFAFVGLLHFINTPAMTLLALIVSVVSLLLYFSYQFATPLIRFRSLAYLKQEDLRARFFYHVMRRVVFEDLVDKQGDFDFKRIFDDVDKKKIDDHISHDELDDLVDKMFMLKEDKISKEYVKAEMLVHFDRDRDRQISWHEFKIGYTNWLEEATSSGYVLGNIWNQVKEKAMMPRILEQVLKKHELVKEDGKDRAKIKGLFSQLAKNGDNVIHRDDLKELIKTLDFRIKLDHDKVWDELVKEFDVDKNESIEEKEFVDGFIKWFETIDLEKAIEKFEKDNLERINALLKPKKFKATIMYAIFGIAITITIASPFITSVRQFSTEAHIPFLFTSFVMAPIVMKTKMVIGELLNAQHHVQKNTSLTFSEIYDQLVMDNLIAFVSLLLVVYIRGLSWTYSAEVLAIMIPCAIVGVFAIKRDTYPLWAAVSAILLYPVSVYIYYVLPNAS